MAQRKQLQRNATDIMKENYLNFFEYTMHWRTYPSVYDGLKLVQRRCLYASYTKMPATTMSKLTSHVGMAMCLHPHAEATETVVKMAGEHQTSFPLYDTQGEFGDCYGNAHAAPRYLECKLNNTARKIYFSLVDEAPMENFEVEEEPLYLPTLFPLALLQGCFSVGQGTPNPLIPELRFDDLKAFVLNYIKTGQTKVTEDNFVRTTDYDQMRNDKNKDAALMEMLNTGKGSVYYQPTVEVKGSTITISNLYILAQFSSLMDKLKEDIQADKIDVMDESGEERFWVVEKVKNKSFDIEACAKTIRQKFTYKENYVMYFHDENGNVRPYSLGEIVSICYQKYEEAYIRKLKKELDALNELQSMLCCLGMMAEHTDIVTDSKLSDEDKVDAIYKAIYQDSGDLVKKVNEEEYNRQLIRKCLDKPIRYLKKDSKALAKVAKDIKAKQHDIEHIKDVIYDEVAKL